MPTPRLTNIAVLSRVAQPRTGNFAAGDRADARQHDLAAMRMAGEHQLHGERGGLAGAGIMREQDGRPPAPFSTTGDLAGLPRPERMPARSSGSPWIVMRVRASRSTLKPRRRERRRHVALIVVIAEDGEDAVRRRRAARALGDRRRRTRDRRTVT